jgi:hypothetical protein
VVFSHKWSSENDIPRCVCVRVRVIVSVSCTRVAHAMYARTEGNRAAHLHMHCKLGGQKGPCPHPGSSLCFFSPCPSPRPARGHRSGASSPGFQSGGWSKGNNRLLLAKSLPSPRTAEEAIALRGAHLEMALGGSGPNRPGIEEEQLLPDALISSMVLPLTIPRRTHLSPPAPPHRFQCICKTVLRVQHAEACPRIKLTSSGARCSFKTLDRTWMLPRSILKGTSLFEHAADETASVNNR